jgi:nucleoside-diphosphate-sugar epimerase
VKVLVLGASGFIGGAVARRLIERGDRVHVMLRDPAAREAWRQRGATVHEGSLGDPEAIAKAAARVERVVHAAGISTPRAAARALRWTHVAGTENVVNACAHAGVSRLVYVGCADATLTDADRVHWDERRPVAGTPFGERAKSLALAEEIAIAAAQPSLEVCALRAAWVWGPGDTSRLPLLCREALDHGGLQLFGDGETYLATIYIENLVDVVLSALSSSDVGGRSFYLADPEYLHTRELFGMLSKAVGLPQPRRGAPLWLALPVARLRGQGPSGLTPDEMIARGRSSLFDVNIAIGKLGFEPKVTTEAGMRALEAWVGEQGGAEAVARLARTPPDERSVDAQVAAAGGD